MKSKISEEPGRLKNPAFTLIELLVVIAIIAILAAMPLPALAKAKQKTQGIYCMNNTKQMTLSWLMYATDCREMLPPNIDGGVTGASASEAAWVAGWLDYTVNNTANTNTDYLVNRGKHPYAAYLGSYIKNPKCFKCPADMAQVMENGAMVDRVRSISCQNWVAGDPTPGVHGSRTWTTLSKYGSYYQKTTDVKGPAITFNFLDERSDSINDGWWATNPDVLYNQIDFPADYHNGAAGFSFVDGHSEIHKWRDGRTIPKLEKGVPMTLNQTLPGDVDVTWMQQHAVGLPNFPY